MASIAASLLFVATSGLKLSFNFSTAKYSFFFAIFYAASLLGLTIALKCGPLSISSLMINYSLIIPTLFGVFFLKEPFGPAKISGFILLVISLFLINYVKSGDSNIKLSLKWIVAIAIAFVGNGMCSTVQKLQQIASNGKYKSEFMIIALIIVFAILLPTSIWFEKGKIRASIKSGGLLAIAYGLANGLVNWLVMFLGNRIPVSILFPVVSAGGIIVSTIISVMLYKEKLSNIQTVGVLAGITSIVFINF